MELLKKFFGMESPKSDQNVYQNEFSEEEMEVKTTEDTSKMVNQGDNVQSLLSLFDKEPSEMNSEPEFNLFDNSSNDESDSERCYIDNNLTHLTGSDEADGVSLPDSKSKPKQENITEGSDNKIMEHRHLKSGIIKQNNNVKFTGPTPDDDDYCAICMDSHREPKTLKKCSHSFCTDCIEEHFKTRPVCPVCFAPYGVITGNMPEGHMSEYVSTKTKLPGYEEYSTIVVSYSFCDGTQTKEHPNPGQMYYGTSRTAYLPNNPEGQKVLKLLQVAFERKLTFTVGRSRTTGCDNVVTWNDIHHKTATHGGQENFGYPDPTYLSRVQEELAAKGVTEESIK